MWGAPMNYYLLTWNPNRYRGDWIDTIDEESSIQRTWSVGNRKHISAGDRVFLMRQGEEPRGIMGAGLVTEDGSHPGPHWPDQLHPHRSDDALYACIEFHALVDPKDPADLFASREWLQSTYPDVHWDTQQSGINIRESVGDELYERVESKFDESR